MKITFIGLGIMGSRMAKTLIKAGHQLTVYNRTKSAAEPLAILGATVAADIVTAVKEVEVVISMLSTPEVVEQLFFGENGAISHMTQDSIWIDCSTVNPSFSRRAAGEAERYQVQFLDGPVAGTLPHAENAELVFFVGGSDKTLAIARPLFDAMGKKTIHMGEHGQGASFKMLVNMMLAQSMVIFSEAVSLGKKLGMDQDFLLDTIPNLVVTAPFVKAKINMIKGDDYPVMFPLEWMHKDLHLASQTAYEQQQPLYLANLAKELFAEAVQRGYGREDFAAVHRLF